MSNRMRILVTGAGGFIGHHLVKRLRSEGHWVRGVDLKSPEYEATAANEFELLDLRKFDNCLMATRGAIDAVYNLAADMGGIGFITAYHADIARNNILINAHMLEASRLQGVRKFLFSSSACVYPQAKQAEADVAPLREEDAFPADPEPGYGWEKLYTEMLCRYFREDYGLETRTVRFHNVYGPLGTYEGGREKAPAAVCRKIALADDGETIEVWGDGEQTRSFMYIDDCVEGLHPPDGLELPRTAEPGQRPADHDQRTGRPGGNDCRQADREKTRPLQAAGRARPQQRQQPDPARTRLGASHLARTGTGRDLCLD